MYISDLISKDKKELNKLSKEQIVETIINSKWQWEHNKNSVTEAGEKLVKQSKGEEAAKLMLAGYLGINEPVDDYTGKLELSKLDLCQMIGQLMCKASRY